MEQTLDTHNNLGQFQGNHTQLKSWTLKVAYCMILLSSPDELPKWGTRHLKRSGVIWVWVEKTDISIPSVRLFCALPVVVDMQAHACDKTEELNKHSHSQLKIQKETQVLN